MASIGITQVMSKDKTEPGPPSGDTETIFVVLEDIPLGEPVRAPSLRLEQWPKDKIPPGALTKIEDIEERRSRTKLYAGEPILDNKLYPKGAGGSVSGQIPTGYRVVSIRVDNVSGTASMVLPGDRVDVLLYLTAGGASTRTIFQDIKVFAVNDIVGIDTDQNGRSINASTISLLVTPEQAQQVMLATQLGTIRLVLRSPEDDEQIDVDESTLPELLGQTKGADREQELAATDTQDEEETSGFIDFLDNLAEQAAAATEAETTPINRHIMRVYSGGQSQDIMLEHTGDPSDSSSTSWKSSGMSTKTNQLDSANPDASSEKPSPQVEARTAQATAQTREEIEKRKSELDSHAREQLSRPLTPDNALDFKRTVQERKSLADAERLLEYRENKGK